LLLTDIKQVAVIPLNYQPEGMKSLTKFNVPSVSLTFDFVKDPASQTEWILNRATMNRLQNGRFDMDLLMVDEEGRLIAAIKHQSLMFERKRHLERQTGSENKHGQARL
jgi:acyl-CoA thioesterase